MGPTKDINRGMDSMTEVTVEGDWIVIRIPLRGVLQKAKDCNARSLTPSPTRGGSQDRYLPVTPKRRSTTKTPPNDENVKTPTRSQRLRLDSETKTKGLWNDEVSVKKLASTHTKVDGETVLPPDKEKGDDKVKEKRLKKDVRKEQETDIGKSKGKANLEDSVKDKKNEDDSKNKQNMLRKDKKKELDKGSKEEMKKLENMEDKTLGEDESEKSKENSAKKTKSRGNVEEPDTENNYQENEDFEGKDRRFRKDKKQPEESDTVKDTKKKMVNDKKDDHSDVAETNKRNRKDGMKDKTLEQNEVSDNESSKGKENVTKKTRSRGNLKDAAAEKSEDSEGKSRRLSKDKKLPQETEIDNEKDQKKKMVKDKMEESDTESVANSGRISRKDKELNTLKDTGKKTKELTDDDDCSTKDKERKRKKADEEASNEKEKDKKTISEIKGKYEETSLKEKESNNSSKRRRHSSSASTSSKVLPSEIEENKTITKKSDKQLPSKRKRRISTCSTSSRMTNRDDVEMPVMNLESNVEPAQSLGEQGSSSNETGNITYKDFLQSMKQTQKKEPVVKLYNIFDEAAAELFSSEDRSIIEKFLRSAFDQMGFDIKEKD